MKFNDVEEGKSYTIWGHLGTYYCYNKTDMWVRFKNTNKFGGSYCKFKLIDDRYFLTEVKDG